MLKILWRHYRAWRRMNARNRMAEQRVNAMRNEWRPVRLFNGWWHEVDDPAKKTGDHCWVGEVNALGERRVRFVDANHRAESKPESSATGTKAYHNARKWEEGTTNAEEYKIDG